MKWIVSLLAKTMRVGPLPYLALCAVILILGVVLQLRSAHPVMADGSTVFGLFARIGGLVGLFGLLPLALTVRDEDRSGEVQETDAEADRADPGQKARPRPILAGGVIGAILRRLPRRPA